MLARHKESLDKSQIKILYFISFLLGVSAAFVLYIESDYFKTAAGSDNITPFYIGAYFVALLLVVNWHHFVKKCGEKAVFFTTLFLKLAVVVWLAFSPVNIASALVLAAYMILSVISWLDLDILLESCSSDKVTGRVRGLYLTVQNAGYLAAPLFAGYLVSRFGLQWAFRGAAVFIAATTIVALFKVRPTCSKKINSAGFFELLGKISTRKNILRIYYISFLLEFFYALIIIYAPLYLLENGFSWAQIGKMIAVALVPFVILQYPAGLLADKKYEERDMLKIALLIMGLTTIAIYFVSSRSLFVWALVLFGTRVGASLVEVLRDSYFYKRIDKQDVDVVDFFRTVRPVAYIVGPLIAAPVVFFFQIKPIFIIIGVVVLTGLFAAKNLASSRIPPKIVKNA
jgi:MFS family permease